MALDLMDVLILNQFATTYRSPALSGGKVGPPKKYLEIYIAPLWPARAEVTQEVPLNSPREAWETVTATADIRAGDLLQVDGAQYQIGAVARWPDMIPTFGSAADFLHLVVEEVKSE